MKLYPFVVPRIVCYIYLSYIIFMCVIVVRQIHLWFKYPIDWRILKQEAAAFLVCFTKLMLAIYQSIVELHATT